MKNYLLTLFALLLALGGTVRAQERAALNGTIADWNRRITYLENLKTQGYTEIPASEWNAYTRGQRNIQRQQHQRDMARVRSQGEKTVGFWRNMSYSQLESSLRHMQAIRMSTSTAGVWTSSGVKSGACKTRCGRSAPTISRSTAGKSSRRPKWKTGSRNTLRA